MPTRVNKLSGVYVITFPEAAGYYKIGCSSDIDGRVSDARCNTPFEIELVHYIICENYPSLEFQLHDHFRAKRHRGEWFKLTPEDVDFIKSIAGPKSFHYADKDFPRVASVEVRS